MAKQEVAEIPRSSEKLKRGINSKSHTTSFDSFFKDDCRVPAKSPDEGRQNGWRLPRWSKMLITSTSSKRSRSIAFDRSRSMTIPDSASASSLPFKDDSHGSHSSVSLSCKYQPRRFEDIIGHEVVVRVISNATRTRKVGNLYLFHGPSGTGKTSTARIFAMALNCQSAGKPCWNCGGCSRSLYLMELCSASRTSGFWRISALLRNTSFVQALPGLKVFIVEESQSLSEEAWDELLGLLIDEQLTDLVFVLVAADGSGIPKSVVSRCQKFSFPRLKRSDVALKVAKIVAQEGFELDREAIELIVSKADGSLREAENILDQLTLLGPRITGSTVQQLVGLVPQEKLLSLLQAAIHGDSEKTVKMTRELTTTGFEAQVIVLQLTSLIADLLSGVAVTDTPTLPPIYGRQQRLPLSKTHSKRLCYALKVLVEAQKQPKLSIEHITWVYSTLLQIATPNLHSDDALPHRESLDSDCSLDGTHLDSIGRILSENVIHGGKITDLRDLGELWRNILKNVDCGDTQEFLSSHAELASLTISAANVILHLMFKTPGDKMEAESREESLVRALGCALGCPVAVNMSLVPSDAGILRSLTSKQHHRSPPQKQNSFFHKLDEAANPSSSANYPTSAGSLSLLKLLKGEGRATDPSVSRTIQKEDNQQWTALTDPSTSPKAKDRGRVDGRSKGRSLSLSSAQQRSDSSVQPYSQDILFENANTDMGPGARKDARRVITHDVGIGFSRSWSCKEDLC